MKVHKLIKDGSLLYISHFLRYVFPLAVVPFLARRLGPDQYGTVLAALSLAALVAIVVEYGFGYSATRDVAASSADGASSILSSVLTTKLVLACPAIAFGAVVISSSSVLKGNLIGDLAIPLGLIQGLNISWFFRAVDKTIIGVIIDIVSQLAYAAVLFIFVSGPGTAVYVLLSQGACLAVGQAVALYVISRSTPIHLVSLRSVKARIGRGAPMFILTAGVAAYTVAGSLILAWLSTPEEVGYFGPADKLISAALQLSGPISALLLPYMARTLTQDRHKAAAMLRMALWASTGCAAAGTVVTVLLAPSILPMFLGPGFEESARVLVRLAVILPLCSVSNCLSILLLLPAGRDRAVTGIALMGAAVSLASAVLLVPYLGAIGLAYGRIATETVVMMAHIVIVVRSGLWHRVPPASLQVQDV